MSYSMCQCGLSCYQNGTAQCWSCMFPSLVIELESAVSLRSCGSSPPNWWVVFRIKISVIRCNCCYLVALLLGILANDNQIYAGILTYVCPCIFNYWCMTIEFASSYMWAHIEASIIIWIGPVSSWLAVNPPSSSEKCGFRHLPSIPSIVQFQFACLRVSAVSTATPTGNSVIK